MVNQVLLATTWYVASCWFFSRSCVAQLKKLVRNFLWSGLDGSSTTRAKVAWQRVILPQLEGSLGIIDPELQSQALLGKLVIYGLTPGDPRRADVEAPTSARSQRVYPPKRR